MAEARTRRHETSIAIAAPQAAVWRALTEADRIVRWLASAASVDPGPGGAIRLSWGGRSVVTGRVEIWEPGRRLRLRSTDRSGSTEAGAIDCELGETGAGTSLRVAHAGLGDDLAWPSFLAILKHDLERHRHEACRTLTLSRAVALPPSRIWDYVTGAATLAAEGRFEAAPAPYRVRTAWGETLSGTVLRLDAPHELLATAAPLGDALLGLSCETSEKGGLVTVRWILYGSSVAEGVRLRERWHGVLDFLACQAPAAVFD